MKLSMDGRGALITGGSLGIERGIAKRFVEAGANVAVVARRQEVLAGEGARDNVLVNSLHVGRIGTAEEFANVALFLASDAGSCITGTAINVDGGLSPVT